jgi:Fe-Mn family superoxide dismutase
MSIVEESVLRAIEENLGSLNEDYAVKSNPFELKTDLLSPRAKKLMKDVYETTVKDLNEVSTLIEGAQRAIEAGERSSYRDLKRDEQRLISQSFLLASFLENIDDQNSVLNMDTLSYMRLTRDWGTFDDWQKDFLACALRSRSGFALTVFSRVLDRYINVCVDSDMSGIPIGSSVVVALCVFDGFYARDYTGSKETYVRAMMKELDWEKIEGRIKKIEAQLKAGKK